MIADFQYDASPGDEVIAVRLFRATPGEDTAMLLVPERVRIAFGDECPAADQVLSIPSALACGVFMAAKSRLPLKISGDRRAWPNGWGSLQSSTLS
jgi:hypothetical protein